MLTIRDHDVEDYVALRDMDATDVGMLSEDDRACLDELGDYLVSTDAFHASQSGCCTSTLNRMQERSLQKASSPRRAEPKPRR